MIFLSDKEVAKMRGAAKKAIQQQALRGHVEQMLAGLPAHTTEWRFHSTRRWRLDFAWPDLKLALEVHGGVHSGGRHTRGKGFTGDRDKMNEAQLLGWIVLEVTPEHIKSGQAKAWLMQALEQKGSKHYA